MGFPRVLRVSVEEVLLPILTACGLPVRKSRVQLQRVMFIMNIITMNIILTGVPLVPMCYGRVNGDGHGIFLGSVGVGLRHKTGYRIYAETHKITLGVH